jgi:oligoribonuclease
MTGLRPEVDRIIEVATLVTDADLNVIAEGPALAVHQRPAVLALMDDWNRATHGASGLLERVRTSTLDEGAVAAATLEFLSRYTTAGSSPMCGNSVCQDRRFLARWMPTLERHFHYRNLDVSTLKELARRWAPGVLAGVNKASSHQALDDIRESLDELRHYRRELFASPWHRPASH